MPAWHTPLAVLLGSGCRPSNQLRKPSSTPAEFLPRVIAPIMGARASAVQRSAPAAGVSAALIAVAAQLGPLESACRPGQEAPEGAATPSRLPAAHQSASVRDSAYWLPDGGDTPVLLSEPGKDDS